MVCGEVMRRAAGAWRAILAGAVARLARSSDQDNHTSSTRISMQLAGSTNAADAGLRLCAPA